MALYLKSCSLKYSTNKKYRIKLLEDSIQHDEGGVRPYLILARIYKELGMKKLSEESFIKGKNNIKRIISGEELEHEDFTDLDRFFDECIRGVTIDEYSYDDRYLII